MNSVVGTHHTAKPYSVLSVELLTVQGENANKPPSTARTHTLRTAPFKYQSSKVSPQSGSSRSAQYLKSPRALLNKGLFGLGLSFLPK